LRPLWIPQHNLRTFVSLHPQKGTSTSCAELTKRIHHSSSLLPLRLTDQRAISSQKSPGGKHDSLSARHRRCLPHNRHKLQKNCHPFRRRCYQCRWATLTALPSRLHLLIQSHLGRPFHRPTLSPPTQLLPPDSRLADM